MITHIKFTHRPGQPNWWTRCGLSAPDTARHLITVTGECHRRTEEVAEVDCGICIQRMAEDVEFFLIDDRCAHGYNDRSRCGWCSITPNPPW